MSREHRAAPLVRVVVALLPLASVPALFALLADGTLDLGGGEKDLVWLLPWTLWGLLFAVSSMILWHRGRPLGQATARAALFGVFGVLAVALGLALFGWLGVGGRF